MTLSNRSPDWDWWRHVPKVALHEAVALSLNLDPKRLRRASTHALLAGKQFDEGLEFERRLALANRCLGDTLPGPLNIAAWHYEDAKPLVRLRDFAVWADSVEWHIPLELARLTGNEQSGEGAEFAQQPEPGAGIVMPEGRRAGAPARVGLTKFDDGLKSGTALAHRDDHPAERQCGATMEDFSDQLRLGEWISVYRASFLWCWDGSTADPVWNADFAFGLENTRGALNLIRNHPVGWNFRRTRRGPGIFARIYCTGLIAANCRVVGGTTATVYRQTVDPTPGSIPATPWSARVTSRRWQQNAASGPTFSDCYSFRMPSQLTTRIRHYHRAFARIEMKMPSARAERSSLD